MIGRTDEHLRRFFDDGVSDDEIVTILTGSVLSDSSFDVNVEDVWTMSD